MDYEDAFLVPDPSPYVPDATFDNTPPAPPQPPPPQCPHCRRRLEAMRGGYREAAERLDAAWSLSQLPCFGVCQCAEFCVTHSLPLHYCTVNSPGDPGHETLVFRSKWERPVSEPVPVPVAAAVSGAPSQEPSPAQGQGGSGTPAAGVCPECTRRLSVMLRADWVRRDKRISEALQPKYELAVQGGPCTGVCQSRYFCKLHLCAAVRDKSSDAVIPGMLRRKATQFSCPLPHEKVANGRHHEQFAYYCDDPCCCAPGRWYSREATHRKPKPPPQKPFAFFTGTTHENASRASCAYSAVPVSTGPPARSPPPAQASTSNADNEGGSVLGGVACKRRAACVAAERRVYVAAMAVEALLIVAAVAAATALGATRACSSVRAGASRSARQVVIDVPQSSSSSSSSSSSGCVVVPRQLCYAYNASFGCANCTREQVRGNASSSSAWECRTADIPTGKWLSGEYYSVEMTINAGGAYVLSWKHSKSLCLAAAGNAQCPWYRVNGTAADSGGVVVLDSPRPEMAGWLFVFH
eukprot:m51a1_g268 hypothetical protein (524) ;mRNA; r:242881-245020